MKHGIKLLVLSLFFIVGCSDSTSKAVENNQTEVSNENNSIDNNNSNENSLNDNNSTLIGKVIDGEISGATLFLDLDRDNELDDNEPSTKTKSDGSYSLTVTSKDRKHENYLNNTAPLVVYGGEDIRTQEIFEDYLMAIRDDSNLTYITPFSTLIAQSLFDELEEIDSNKLQKSNGERVSSLKEKIAVIKSNLAELFGLNETILDKNPIELAKAGDNSLLSKSLQLHKSARSMRRAMKKDVRRLKKSILKSYRSLGREFRKLKRSALRDKDEALVEALENSMNDSELFDSNLVKDVRKETRELIRNINSFWRGQEGTLTDNELSDTIREGESRLNSDTSTPIPIPTPTPTPTVITTDPIFSEFNVGIGGSSSFPFTPSTGSNKIWMSIDQLLLNDTFTESSYYQNIKNFNEQKFQTLQNYVKNSKFMVFWLTDGWKESWFNIESIQKAMNAGHIPVFSYWYFGDRLIQGMPNEEKKEKYAQDNIRVANFLKKLNGKKMLIMEPEFNKAPVLKSEETQHEFASIISKAIDTIKAKNPKLLFTLSMMDIGSRSIYETLDKCGYENCALGDKYAWSRSDIVFDDLIDKLDFISFHQMVAKFSRDYANPGGWDSPNIRVFDDDAIGIDFLAERVSNMSQYLHEKYDKPVFLPYVTVATATWEDNNSDGVVDSDEINYYGWENKANSFYKRMAELRPTLQDNGLFGFAPMALFDNPRHDYGGYQYFMQNEYHLGIMGTGAKDEVDIAPDGDLYFKGKILDYIYNFDFEF